MYGFPSTQQQYYKLESTSSTDDATQEQLLVNLCQELKILYNETLIERAKFIYQKGASLSQVLEFGSNRQVYLAFCSLFIASRLESPNDLYSDEQLIEYNKFSLKIDGPVSIGSLIHKPNMNLVETFELLNNTLVSLQFENSACYSVLQKSQKKLILCHYLFERYQECFREIITPTTNTDLFKVGWITLVVLCRRLPSVLLDFTESANCLINFMIFFWKTAKDVRLSETIDELYSICNIAKDKVDPRYDEFITNTLRQLNISDFTEYVTGQDSLAQINSVFEKDVDNTLGSLGFDERIFMYTNDINIVGDITKLTSAPVFQLNPPRQSHVNDPFRSPLKSPGHGGFSIPLTPLQATLQVTQVIEESVKDTSPGPDEALLTYFKSCSPDQTATIENRLSSLLEKVNLNNLFTFNSLKRKSEISKIYYKTLKHMLQAEEKRLGGATNFSNLLTNENFHRSLIVCAVECIAFGYNSKDSIGLVDLLNHFALEPFELSIVIESFVQNATWLNSALKRHFKHVEERLLESLAWRKNSVLYSKLSNSTIVQPPKPGSETPSKHHSHETFGMYSPIASRKQPVSKGSNSVQFFFRKMYKLVSRRIQELCYNFNQTQQNASDDPMIITMDLMEQVWHIVYYALNEARTIMVNRHIDHVIMCSMYAICNKVNRMRISFKDIIFNYRLICENNRSLSPVEIGKILWQVPLDKDGEFGDIVKFYNSVYIPAVKSFILDKTSGNSQFERPEMPYVELFAKTKIAPNFVLSPRKSQYSRSALLSPSRDFPASIHLTPRTKALYEFGSCSTKKHFDVISSSNNDISPSPGGQNVASDFSKRGVKRTLDFGEETETSSSNDPEQRKFVKIHQQEQ
nr:unnamed protein product [Naegleria fowleri]